MWVQMTSVHPVLAEVSKWRGNVDLNGVSKYLEKKLKTKM